MSSGRIYNKLNKIQAVAYSLKDAIGVSIGGLPVRLNEIVISVTTFLYFAKKHDFKLKRNDFNLLACLFLSVFISFLVGLANKHNIDNGFFLKYMLRGGLYVILMTMFLASKRIYKESDIQYLCKSILIVNFVFFIILYVTGYHLDIGRIIDIRIDTFQVMNLFGRNIPRFFGTATEAGYLGPFMMLPLYFYFSSYLQNKRYIKELCILAIMLFMTLSAMVYLMAGIVVLVAIKKNGKIRRRLFYTILIVLIIIIMIFAYYTSEIFSDFANTYFINKLLAVMGTNSQIIDYSGSDRSMHFQNCLYLINQQPIFNRIFGAGTGYYAYNLSMNQNLFSAAEEAYNLYLSTLLDRGIVGFLLLILIFICVSKYHIEKDFVSTSIYISIVCQYIHWMITGNMWVCYFWMELMYLIGYYKYRRLNND